MEVFTVEEFQERFDELLERVEKGEHIGIIDENEKAVGNMGTNARGDQVDKHGNIIRNRNDIMKDHYNPANKRPRG